MRRAWLRKSKYYWELTGNPEEVLLFDGEFILCEKDEDIKLIEERIAASTGMHVRSYYNYILCHELPFFRTAKDAIGAINDGKEGAIVVLPHGIAPAATTIFDRRKNNVFSSSRYPGFVGVPEECGNGFFFFKIFYDMKKWKRQQKITKPKGLGVDELHVVCHFLLQSMGVPTISSSALNASHFMPFIWAHDHSQGRRKTNEIIRDVAKKWMENADVNRAKYGKTVSEDLLAGMEKRFKSAARSRTVSKTE